MKRVAILMYLPAKRLLDIYSNVLRCTFLDAMPYNKCKKNCGQSESTKERRVMKIFWTKAKLKTVHSAYQTRLPMSYLILPKSV